MPFSKRSVYISLTVLAALSLQVGCGDNKRPNTPKRGTLAATQNQTPAQKAAADKAAAAERANAGGGTAATTAGTPDAAVANSKLETQLNEVKSTETPLQSGTRILKEELSAGTYDLKSVTTSFYYVKKAESLRAVHESTVIADSSGSLSLNDAGNSKFAGTMTNDVDAGRKLEVPVEFKVGASWAPSRDEASNITISTQVSSTGTNYRLTDNFLVANPIKASIMTILATVSGSQDTKNSSDKLYVTKDEKGVAIYMRLIKVDAQNLRIYMSFEEKIASSDPAADSAKSITEIRNVYLNYKITQELAPANATKPATLTPAATTTPNVPATPPAATPMTVQQN